MELQEQFLLVFLQGPVSQVQAPLCARRCPGPQRCPGPRGQNEEPGRTGLSLQKVGFHVETQETEETGKMRRQAKSKGRVASRQWAASRKEITPRAGPGDAPAGKMLGAAWPRRSRCGRSGRGEAGS